MANMVNDSGARTFGPYEYRLGDELRGERATLGKTLLDIQRDLRIKAAYIAAIEDAKPEVFPNPSFIAGYVRSYARYLGMEPDEVFHRFCLESGFVGKAGAPVRTGKGAVAVQPAGGFRPDFAIARLDQAGGALASVPFAALGSLVVLAAVALGLGYGGWTVLQNIQRVQFAPVDDLPVAMAQADEPPAPAMPAFDEPTLGDLASPVATTALAELYRKQELEVPIVVPRDGPIAALDPDKVVNQLAVLELVCDQINADIDHQRDIGLVHLTPMFERLAGPDGLTRNRSMFGRREIIQGICELLPNGAPIANIVDWANLFAASEHCVELTGTGAAAIRTKDGRVVSARTDETRYSTPDMLATERRLIDTAIRRTGSLGMRFEIEVESRQYWPRTRP